MIAFRSRVGGGTRILGDAVVTTGALFVTSASLALIAVATARLLGPTERGVLVISITVAGFANHVTSAGISVPARVLLARDDTSRSVSGFLTLSLLLVALQGIVAALAIPLLLSVADVDISGSLYVSLIGYALAITAALFSREALYGIGKSRAAAGFEAVGGTTQLVMVVGALVAVDSPVAWQALAAMAFGNVTQLALQVKTLARSKAGLRPLVDLGMYKFLLRKGIYGLGVNLGQIAALRADRYILALFASSATVGIYSVAATGADYLWLGPLALSQVLFHGVASGGLSWNGAMRAHWIVLPLVVLGGLAAYAVAPELVPFVFGPAYEPAAGLVRVFVVGAPAVASFHVTSTTLAGHGRLRQAAMASASGGVMTTGLCLLLIPSFGALGAAWASVGSYWSMATISFLLLLRQRTRPDGDYLP